MAPLSDDPQYLWWMNHTAQSDFTPFQLANMIRMHGEGHVENPPVPRLPDSLVLQAVIIPGDKEAEGTLIRAVALPWFEIVASLQRDPQLAYNLEWRKWEEIVAAAYRQAGCTVVLTPPSNDGGRDIIATWNGIGSIRILDQVKRYKPGHLVKADEVRAMLGVLDAERNASKAFLTTTSDFAPGVLEDPRLTQYMPGRLELRNREQLLDWLATLAASGPR